MLHKVNSLDKLPGTKLDPLSHQQIMIRAYQAASTVLNTENRLRSWAVMPLPSWGSPSSETFQLEVSQ